MFWFFQAKYWNFKDTYDIIFEHKCWASHNLPVHQEPIQYLINSGMIYIAGRSKPAHQPIIVVHGSKF